MIRDFTSGDFQEVSRIHQENGYSFELPNFEHPLVIVRKVLDDGGVKMAAIGRLHCSALMWVDANWKTPEERLAAIKELQNEMMKEASEKYGLDVVTTQADGRFAIRLEKDLGWFRGHQAMFYRTTKCV